MWGWYGSVYMDDIEENLESGRRVGFAGERFDLERGDGAEKCGEILRKYGIEC
jgi:hypothetical protein